MSGGTGQSLPSGAPLAAQFLHGSLVRLSPSVRSDILNGRVNSRRVRAALAQLARDSDIPLIPSRREMIRAARYLDALRTKAVSR